MIQGRFLESKKIPDDSDDAGQIPPIYIYMYIYMLHYGTSQSPYIGSMSFGLARNIDCSSYNPMLVEWEDL